MSLLIKLKNFIRCRLHRYPLGQRFIRYRNRKNLKRRHKILYEQGIANFPFPPFKFSSLLKKNPTQGLGLIFFMGMGDYLFATPVLERLRKKYPNRFLRAYTGRFADNNNSALNYRLLKTNPIFDDVVRFDGYPRSEWWFYDTSMAYYHNASEGTPCLMLPVLYAHPAYYHRTIALSKTFGIQEKVERPILYPCQEARERAEKFIDGFGGFKGRHVILLHCDARSSGIAGHEMKIRIAGMLRSEFKDAIILTVGEIAEPSFIRESLTRKQYQFWSSPILDTSEKFMGDPAAGGGIISLDLKTMSILDSIEVVRLAQEHTNLTAICVNSVFWPITSALAIPTLGLHLFSEYCVADYWYGNIHLLTSQFIKNIPKNKQRINIKYPHANEGEMTPDFDEIQVFVEYMKIQETYDMYIQY